VQLFTSDKIHINKWSVWKGPLPCKGKQCIHIIIIIFKEPSLLKYLYVTSKTKTVKKKYKNDKQAVVKLSESDWKEVLKTDSYIQCGKDDLFEIETEEFRKLYDNENEAVRVKPLGVVPEDIKNRIIKAIRKSKTYSEREKETYTKLYPII